MKDTLTGFTALAALDATLDCLRLHGAAIVSSYAPWALPFLIASLAFIRIVDEGDTSLLLMIAPLLVITGYCRWLGALAASVTAAERLGGIAHQPFRSRIPPYFRARFRFHPALAGPVAMDAGAWLKPVARIKAIKQANRAFFSRITACMALFSCVIMCQLIALAYFLFDLVLPYMLGLDERLWREIALSKMWWTGIVILLLIGLEIFLSVLGAVAYHRLASRWTGTDLAQRLEERQG